MPRYLPSLETLISLNDIPDSLGFIENAAIGILENIYFDHFQKTGSRYGETKSYVLDVIVNAKLGFEIPGTGISLLLNPANDADGQDQTVFNISLTYRLGILKLINNFSFEKFSYKPNDLISLFLGFAGIEPSILLENISTHINVPDEIVSPFISYSVEELVDFFNTYYQLSDTTTELVYFDGMTDADIETGLAVAGITSSTVIDEFGIITDYPGGDDRIEDVYSQINVDKNEGPLPISVLVDMLNNDYFLVGTPNEIIYISDTETTYDVILSGLKQAGISTLDLLNHYVFADISTFDEIEQALVDFFSELVMDPSGITFVGLFVPFFQTSINNLNLALEFPRSALNPIDPATNLPYTDQDIKSLLRFNVGEVTFSTTDGFTFDSEDSFSFDKSEIGNTGLILSFTDAKLDLSTTTNIPEANEAGYPDDFVGVYVKAASIEFTNFGVDDTTKPASASITVENFLIGTGGVSGTIKLVDNGLLHRKFGNFEVELDTFSLTLRQGVITTSNIAGALTLPSGFNNNGVPTKIGINARIKDNGEFDFTASVTGNLPSFTLPGVFTLTLRQLSVGSVGDRFFISVAGTLDFIVDLPLLGEILPKGVIIDKLVIWDDGSLEFQGGGLTIPKAFRLQVGPVKLEVSHLSLSTHLIPPSKPGDTQAPPQRKYYCFGFDGMINTGIAGVEAEGNGIKYYFTHDGGFDQFITIDGFGVDITIPENATPEGAAFTLDGYLSMKNPDPGKPASNARTEYTGSIAFSIPRLGVDGSAAMRLTPSVPDFVVDLGIELPAAIPLGPTGLGIYALRGLIGKSYIPSKTAAGLQEDATWWDYYKVKSPVTHEEGVSIDKFAEKSGFSLGVGVSLATDLADSGFIFSTKLFMLLNLPNVFLIYGQGGIIRSRLGLVGDQDPPFQAQVVLSNDSFLGNLDINFDFPNVDGVKGFILSLKASLDLGFFFNNISGWYLNIGKDTPASSQVQAKILTLFHGHAYLMISARGIKIGAGVDFNFKRNFGPVGVDLGAFLELAGFISFKPVQVGGSIALGGHAYLRFGPAKIGLGLKLAMGVEAPNPFNLIGSFQVTFHLLFFSKTFTISLSKKINNNRLPLEVPVALLGLPNPDNGYNPVAAHHILTNEIFPVNYVTVDLGDGNLDPVNIPAPHDSKWKYDFTVESSAVNVTVPLDSFIDIELLKPVLPINEKNRQPSSGQVSIGGAGSLLPAGYSELVPPKKGVDDQVKHQYQLVSLGLYMYNGSAWVPYDLYEAVTAIVASNTGPGAIDLGSLKAGYWQFTEKDKFNKIRLLSQNMFSYRNGMSGSGPDPDALNFAAKDIFCFDNLNKEKVVNWHAVAAETVYPAEAPVLISLLDFVFSGLEATVLPEAGGLNALKLGGYSGTLLINFPEPVARVVLEFGDNTNHLQLSFNRAVYSSDAYGFAVTTYQPLAITAFNPGDTDSPSYDAADQPVNQVSITFDTPVPADYLGDLVIGGHFRLPDSLLPVGQDPDIEADKALLFVSCYNRSLSAAEILAMDYTDQDGIVAQWEMDARAARIGSLTGITAGYPDSRPGFFRPAGTGAEQVHTVYDFTVGGDALVIPYDPLLRIENDSFAISVTALFDPSDPGMSTLLSKVNPEGNKGFALHLVRRAAPSGHFVVLDAPAGIPEFRVVFSCYDGAQSTAITVNVPYTLDCDTHTAEAMQYQQVVVSVDRVSARLDIYFEKILRYSGPIPAELGIYEAPPIFTFLEELRYTTAADQVRLDDNGTSQVRQSDEVEILNNALNKTIQPVWRPETTYAISIATQDVVSYRGNTVNDAVKNYVFGFKTAGPVGNFHQHNKIYLDLDAADQAKAFKLADLRYYIDFNRSFPDALSRYNLSKPVFQHLPQIKLYFLQPYVNAMYSDWAAYRGLPALSSGLSLELLDEAGNSLFPHLEWQDITLPPVTVLPRDLQLLSLFNQQGAQGTCTPLADTLQRRLHQGSYEFDDLKPNKLYTALFSATYSANTQNVEVYRFNFMTSRYTDFTQQASSFDLDGNGKYALYDRQTAFRQADLDGTLKPLIDTSPDNDPAFAVRYAIPYERVVYGGLQLPAPEPFEHSVIQPVINTDPDTGTKTILGILLYNPEPFNDPKLPAAELADTFGLSLTPAGGPVQDSASFLYFISGDTSAVFITNTEMNLPAGSMSLHFKYKIFNGIDYTVVDYSYPGAIPLVI